MRQCFDAADILLPASGAELDKWAVVACDQYTSQPEYWDCVERYVGNVPSALRIIYPEIYLGKEDAEDRIHEIQRNMRTYLEQGILVPAVRDGFVLVERRTESGIRPGLVGKIDLDAYEFQPEKQALIHATEGTVQERIPPRVRIREGAKLEAPHVMLLIDDPERQLLEPLYDRRTGLRKLYGVELMQGGGRLCGYAVEGEEARKLREKLHNMEERSGGLLFSVGDGNHSLAAAKACWEKVKGGLGEEERRNHPARYALVEVVNLYGEALKFEPIHRFLQGVDMEELADAFQDSLHRRGIGSCDGSQIVFSRKGRRRGFSLSGAGERLPVDILQEFLDACLKKNPKATIDYIHGEDALEMLVEATGGCGIHLEAIHKSMLFPAIRAGGVLPRKTFSMGEAHEKRYYMECRLIGCQNLAADW